ncbi:MAG: DUF5343 domain-containing protein [Candidatus Atribacteria bacterium]|nr:DUF5343 domain-containing protein [Candidatus Atribacteria bacterium]
MSYDKGENFAPYASPSNVMEVVKRFRETGLTWPLTKDEIQRVGISPSLANRTLSALEFLGLIDEEGNRTEALNGLGRASTNEYKNILAEILRSAYSDIFQILDPSTANDIQLDDAFRGKQPEKQRSRMVTLFKGLCTEAELIKGEIPNIKPNARASSDDKLKERNKNSGKVVLPYVFIGEDGTEFWFRQLEPVFRKLPLPSKPEWTTNEKNKWEQALMAMLDLYIQVKDDEGAD